mmetsp:Transcript_6021/g.13104  ORF Transcript_6021/g.13104 Transcript_6021/m.13104 type:complete len:659 (+) Transcript_6021:43-2019(+)|eukprot:CAMPEP_0178506962 /NCGR_PEP_ID=MMETSP0696-20121128/19964_1 /TAXON_ID=265572 /ORGANISM="Extubocellulus spinifer, Strain CCMP396" /LENGTH=658 /DNA_ID=CAMNT_0020136415 /DNA_START=33 /DNA_END=2009 /DNA_ORIENTATION=-
MSTTTGGSGSPYLLRCALSGETPPIDPVVTPSGHICSRRLLLTKLTENGGVDPFDVGASSSSNPRTLDESDLIELVQVGTAGASAGSAGAGGATIAPPRLPSATSFPAILTHLQNEHDALMLELYDTRRSLEETRRELSQALYQNDAGVRVVARLVLERDAAREQLAAAAVVVASSGGTAAGSASVPAAAEEGDGGRKRGADAMEIDENESANNKKKKPDSVEGQEEKKVDSTGDSNNNDNEIPQSDLDEMIALWKALSKTRKKKSKKSKEGGSADADGGDGSASADSAAAVVTMEAIQENRLVETSKKSLHKSSSKAGILDVAFTASPTAGLLVTTGRDRQTVVYDVSDKKIVATLVGDKGVDVGCSDILTKVADASGGGGSSVLVATGAADGTVRLYSAPTSSSTTASTEATTTDEFTPTGTVTVDGGNSAIAAVSIHPCGKYVVAATKVGKVAFLALREGGTLVQVALLGQQGTGTDDDAATAAEYTCGSLHPDGLIYGAGTADGAIMIWDLKSQTLAGTLKAHGEGEAITSLDISENGYHFASSTSSGTVQVWDLRKLKCVATLNTDGADVGSVHSVAFSPNEGKMLAYGGAGGTVTFVPVKDWDKKAVVASKAPKKGKAAAVTSVAWMGGRSLATCSDSERPVRFWGLAEETE